MKRRDAAPHSEANRDPITGASGAHPLGTGVGALLGGAAAGAAAGTVVGPVGTVVGLAAGALAGGLAGKGIAEMADPTVEDAYWRENFANRPYVERGSSFDDYGPAYGYGVRTYSEHRGRSFDAVEPTLSRDWHAARGTSSLSWDRAQSATRDAWNRLSDTVERAVPGDSDRDGK